ncbi:hypothetical protein ACE02B_00030 [Shewanella mangrovisoli]|uniref:hypothetical protein n=1 Tax=Shewanella mangrovisoli TaxID=2864211 RepID=UPI0035B7DF32
MNTPNSKLARAQAILKAPITMDAILEYHAIAKAAEGDEAWMIDELFNALFAATSATDEELFYQAIAEGLL